MTKGCGNDGNGEVSDVIAGIRIYVKRRFCGTEPLFAAVGSALPGFDLDHFFGRDGCGFRRLGLFGTTYAASGLDFGLCRPCLQCGRVGFDQDESAGLYGFLCLFHRADCGFRRHFLCFGFRCRAFGKDGGNGLTDFFCRIINRCIAV